MIFTCAWFCDTKQEEKKLEIEKEPVFVHN